MHTRPVSESEREMGRVGASEIFPVSERQYIWAIRSERNLEWHVIFRFVVLYNSVLMSVASRLQNIWEPSHSKVPLFQHQHLTNLGCFWVTRCLCKLDIDLQPSRLVLLGIVFAYMRKMAQNAQKSFAAGASSQTPRGSSRRSPKPLVGGLWIR